MTQLIFVHGVATRSGLELARTEATIKALLARTVFTGRPFTPPMPRWGDFVPAVVAEVYETDSPVEAFAIGKELDNGDGASAQSAGSFVQTKPAATLDAVMAAFIDAIEEKDEDLTPEALNLFAQVVDAIGSTDGPGLMVGTASTDDELAAALTPDDRSADAESFSIESAIGTAIDRVTGRVRQAASGLIYGLIRDYVRPSIGLFSGDVFAYLHVGEVRQSIQKVVGDALREAHAQRTENEPLIVVGHSMGGVILVDMLSDLVASNLPADLKVDRMFTVGSQSGLFNSVGALTGSEAAHTAKRPKPACVAGWFNVFDPLDPLAFRAAPAFLDVEDVKFDSATGVVSAHTTYFKRPQFYARMRKRLAGLDL